ncbi:hypothetical protein, conserved [Trypanosoma brucei brucei TREU927]|uniref:Atg6 BARA domain-containing protein n=1 Tax=Trypanosoma brucei brucei (strain 927/4 GUTat10.1) TaxID=185431 RepID=Q57Z66_TRYB2|nr:hypothetical protein, conserved [Trypanosoma brucei brucei TREU927]AAX79567.1 hypothetical protein, conserved [Trypanosoma brucei]AAZ11440.1 hypothetical protein, conserved [Trypanosoma brucei brucei TREU927]
MGDGSHPGGSVCALFVCCVCRRSVPLAGQSTVCTMNIPGSAKRIYKHKKPEFLSRAQTNTDEDVKSAKECCAAFPVTSQRNERHQQGKVRLHPAVKGSRTTATGKYGALSPSPFTPWSVDGNSREASQYTESDCGGASEASTTYGNVKKVAMGRAQITATLPETFAHQYAWFPKEKNDAYISDVWSSVQEGSTVPSSGALNPSTALASAPCSNILQDRLPIPLASLILSTPFPSLNISTPHIAGIVEAESPGRSGGGAADGEACNRSNAANLEECDDSNEYYSMAGSHLSFTFAQMGGGLQSNESHALRTPSPRPQRSGNAPTNVNAELNDVSCSRIGLARTLTLERTVSCGTISPPPMTDVYKALLTQFSERLMRQVVHGSTTDLPLCISCWISALAGQKDATTIAMKDLAKLMEVAEIPDELEVQPSGYHVDKSNCKEQQDRQSGVFDLQQQESLERLSIEVDEAESHLAHISWAHLEVADEMLPDLKAQREETSRKIIEVSIRTTAYQTKAFYEVAETAAALEKSIQNMSQSYTLARSTRATSLAFPINTKGSIGTIARLRLGKVAPNTPKQTQVVATPATNKEAVPAISEDKEDSKDRSDVSCCGAGEFTALTTMQQQVCLHFTRGLLDKRQGFVSTTEINNACGYLLLLLQHLIEWHNINTSSVILHPNGERSTIELKKMRSAPPDAPNITVDFFIKDNFFSRKTFDKACFGVASCVREITVWMGRRLQQLRECVERSERGDRSETAANADTRAEVVKHGWVTPSSPPFAIKGEKVGGLSVRYGEVSDGEWTAAMRNLLDVVHWCVVVSCEVNDLQQMLFERDESSSS